VQTTFSSRARSNLACFAVQQRLQGEHHSCRSLRGYSRAIQATLFAPFPRFRRCRSTSRAQELDEACWRSLRHRRCLSGRQACSAFVAHAGKPVRA